MANAPCKDKPITSSEHNFEACGKADRTNGLKPGEVAVKCSSCGTRTVQSS